MPKGQYKRKPLSEETKRKISEALKGHPSYQNKERGKKISKAQKGKKLTEEHRKRISKGIEGNTNMLGKSGEKSASWLGDDVGYSGVHVWVRQTLGQEKKCSFCKTEEDRMYHWANISGEHKREVTDWVRLCVPCHSAFDRGIISMLKKKKVQVQWLKNRLIIEDNTARRNRWLNEMIDEAFADVIGK